MQVLVTGGAGLIGSHTVDLLIDRGHRVTVLDSLDKQVHGNQPPNYLNPHASYVWGNVTVQRDWIEAGIKEADAIIHLAAQLNAEESIYKPTKYVYENAFGTAVLFSLLMKMKLKVKKIVVASSEAIYGEGPYLCQHCGKVYPLPRSKEQLERGDWEVHCPKCNEYAVKLPVTEDDIPQNLTTYALTKYAQEKLTITYGKVLDIPSLALRYFNVYGPRQSLTNPYSGVCSLFINRIKHKEPLMIFEDGKQVRDFIFVKDVARCNVLAVEEGKGVEVYNVGSGNGISILELAKEVKRLTGSDVDIVIPSEYRLGDDRSGGGNISKIENELGFKPSYSIQDGLAELIEWADDQNLEAPKC